MLKTEVKYKFYVSRIDNSPILKFSFTYYGHYFYRNMNLRWDEEWEEYLFKKFNNDQVGIEEKDFLKSITYKMGLYSLSIEDIIFVFDRLNLETIIRDLVIGIIESYNEKHQSKIKHKKDILHLKNLATKDYKILSITEEMLK